MQPLAGLNSGPLHEGVLSLGETLRTTAVRLPRPACEWETLSLVGLVRFPKRATGNTVSPGWEIDVSPNPAGICVDGSTPIANPRSATNFRNGKSLPRSARSYSIGSGMGSAIGSCGSVRMS